MKFAFHVSPNLQTKNSTQRIMRDLTIGLGVVFAASVIYYWMTYGPSYGLQPILLLACSLATTFICEAVFAKAKKSSIKETITHSFGWVTSLILVMMCPISITPYAVIVATFFAIAIGRLVFGGFGFNIYNPAAVGRAVIFASFSGAATKLVTSATPTGVLAETFKWLPTTEKALQSFLDYTGGWSGLWLGTYPGAIGETFSLLILVVGVVLALRHVLDWRLPVFYLGGIFVIAMVIALLKGVEAYHGIPGFLWYPMLHLLTGGVIFGGVFMLTDPVTVPTVPSGRIFFALCAAAITVLIRMNGNLPEGCLYSILIMNTFTPMIEQTLDRPQLAQMKKAWLMIACALVFGLCVSFYSASNVRGVKAARKVTKTALVMPAPVESEVQA